MEDHLISMASDIQVPDINSELKRLGKRSQDLKHVRACLFTLVIYAKDTHRAHYMEELVKMILEKFPCRIIFVRTDINPEKDHLIVKVSHELCEKQEGESGTTIACDRIDIDVSPNQLVRIPFLILPHLVPDLPVYLLWGEIPYHDKELFPQLQKFASRVIFDSECAQNIHEFCVDMLAHFKSSPIEIMDINWAFLSSWRDVFSQLFSSEEKLAFLKQCKSMVITYNATMKYTMAHPEIRALYLQSWIASSMGWKYSNVSTFQNNLVTSYLSKTNPVIVALAPRHDENLPPGSVIGVELATTEHNSLSIMRKENLQQVLVHVSSAETCELPIIMPLPNVHRGFNFLKEIFYSTLGDHYKEMLKLLSEMNSTEE